MKVFILLRNRNTALIVLMCNDNETSCDCNRRITSTEVTSLRPFSYNFFYSIYSIGIYSINSLEVQQNLLSRTCSYITANDSLLSCSSTEFFISFMFVACFHSILDTMTILYYYFVLSPVYTVLELSCSLKFHFVK